MERFDLVGTGFIGLIILSLGKGTGFFRFFIRGFGTGAAGLYSVGLNGSGKLTEGLIGSSIKVPPRNESLSLLSAINRISRFST